MSAKISYNGTEIVTVEEGRAVKLNCAENTMEYPIIIENIPTAKLIVTAPTGSTVTCVKGGTTLTATEVSGTWTFSITDFGVWTVNATKSGQSASQQVEITEARQYSLALAYFTATIEISAPVGSSVTVKKGTSIINTHTGTGNPVAVTVHETGTYEATATQGTNTATDSASITADGQTQAITLVFSKPISQLSVGSSVYMNVNGTKTEFLVVHQGKPSSTYSTTFDGGTILLSHEMIEGQMWHDSDVNDYANSTLHSYLNNDFLAQFDTNIQSVIKQVKVPYRQGSGTSQTVTSGENGLSCKIFLLSGAEVGFTSSDAPYIPTDEGAKLSYFLSGDSQSACDRRQAVLDGQLQDWWLRSPYCNGSTRAYEVNSAGQDYGRNCSSKLGVRPAFVVPNTTKVSDDGILLP